LKALIFNSGQGNRMGDFTRTNHKSMAVLSNGETIFGRQLRLLMSVGITDIVVTTGPHVEQLRSVATEFPALTVTFVPNNAYDRTNYIYSMHLARELLDDDLLMLHGDLVFNRRVLGELIADDRPEEFVAGAAHLDVVTVVVHEDMLDVVGMEEGVAVKVQQEAKAQGVAVSFAQVEKRAQRISAEIAHDAKRPVTCRPRRVTERFLAGAGDD